MWSHEDRLTEEDLNKHERGINMVKLESRPRRGAPFEINTRLPGWLPLGRRRALCQVGRDDLVFPPNVPRGDDDS